MTATLIQIRRDGKILNYFCNGLYFIVDKTRQAGYIVKGGKLIERVTGSAFISYGINFIESYN
jgi:hypothetical protein